jgi:hypothetical protein
MVKDVACAALRKILQNGCSGVRAVVGNDAEKLTGEVSGITGEDTGCLVAR